MAVPHLPKTPPNPYVGKAATTALQTPHKVATTTPRITYSLNKKEVSGLELAHLLSAAYAPHLAQGSSQLQQSFNYWKGTPDFIKARKLSLAVERSIAVVAAFAPVCLYGDVHKHASGTGTRRANVDMNWNWLREGPTATTPPKSLVGFARAIGDRSLVATIYDVAVHPNLQGYGLGSKLLKLLVRQLYGQGIYDIGLVTPSSLQPFLNSCQFEKDRSVSTPMTFGVQELARQCISSSGDVPGSGCAPVPEMLTNIQLADIMPLEGCTSLQTNTQLLQLLDSKIPHSSSRVAGNRHNVSRQAVSSPWMYEI